MERPEIIEGLKNAIERGYSLDIAIKSFVNAGYNAKDVEDSARMIGGVLMPNVVAPTAQPPQPRYPQPSPQPYRPQMVQQPQPRFPQPVQPVRPVQPQPSPQPYRPQMVQPIIQQYPQREITITRAPRKNVGLIIFLVIILILLIGALMTVILARDWVMDLLGSIGISF